MPLNRDRLHPLHWRWRLATAQLRALPGLIIIGAQKAGTTSLFHYLGQHPQMVPPFRKEVHFFDNNFVRQDRWYRAHFPLHSQLVKGRVAFEASPLYLFNPLVPARIAATLPRVKLIAVLRDPSERAISQYFMQCRKGRESLPISEALAAEEQRLAGPIAAEDYSHPTFAHFSYKSRGLYAEQLKRYRAAFSADQLLILESGELFNDPGPVLRRVFAFAGVDPSFEITSLGIRNLGENRTDVDYRVRRELDDYFRPHNEQLYAMIGRDLGWGVGS